MEVVRLLFLGALLGLSQAQMPPPPANGEYMDDDSDDSQAHTISSLPEPQAGQEMKLMEPGQQPVPVVRKSAVPQVLSAVNMLAAQPGPDEVDMSKPELAFKHGTASYQPEKCKTGAWGSCEQKALADIGGGVMKAPSGQGTATFEPPPPPPPQQEEPTKAVEPVVDGTPGLKAPTMLYTPKVFKIQIRVPMWDPLLVYVEDGYSARTTKAILEAKYNIRNTRLWFKQKEIKDDMRLKDAGVGPEDIVNVVVRCSKAKSD